MNESAEVSGEKPEEFSADPKRNFLPHIVETAKKAGLRLCFVREKRYPLPDGTTPQTEDMRRYMADLESWVESQGCLFIGRLVHKSKSSPSMTKFVEHVIVGEHHTAISGPAVPDPRDLLVPYPAEPMTMWPILTRVNKPENDDEAILDC